MKDFRLVLCRGLRCGVLVAGLRVTLMAQTFTSTTVLSANNPSLVLPGSLTLTSTVNQPAAVGGVPTGSIAFTYDKGTSLGSAPLQLLPSTQGFLNAPTASASSQGTNSGGLVALDLFGTGKPVLVVGNNNFSSPASVSILSNLGGGKFGGAPATAIFQSASKIDQIASGYFFNKTTQSALVHQPFFYNVVYNASGTPAVISSTAGPQSSSTEVEFVAIDDFDGDGYSDVGVLLMADDIVGVALNEGSSAPGMFAPLVQAQLPTDAGTFCVDGITTGKFDAAFNSELAVLGHYGICSQPAPTNPPTPSYVVLYAGPTAAPNFTETTVAPFSVSLSDSTPGAVIYYTTDGTTPTTASPVYSAPIPLTAAETTITAMAVAPGDAQSATVNNVYFLDDAEGEAAGPHTKDRRLVSTSRTIVASPKLLPPIVTSTGTSAFVGFNQATIASADFNHDGNLDLVIGSGISGQLQLFYGNGDGSFTAPTAPIQTPAIPLILNVNDFNGDGYPDVAMTLSGPSDLAVLLNDGTGKLNPATQPYSAGAPIAITSADLNSDGLPDLALLRLQPPGDASIDTLLSSESAQASLITAAKSLPAGSHTLTASYPGDTNFSASNSTSISETVTQTIPSINWATPAPIDLTTPPPALGTQLDATATVPGTFTYSPPANTPLSLGQNILGVMFVPADSFDYAEATAQVTQQVNLPPASLAVAIEPGSDPSQPSIDITFQPFPEPVIMTITLGFTDGSSNPAASNGSIKFVNVPQGDNVTVSDGQPSDGFMVTANSPAALAPRVFSIGNVAGTVAVTVQLLLQDKTNITPTALVPPTVPVPATVPSIQTATYSISGSTLTVVVVASSSTRDISGADFHFTPVAGKTLKTTDLNMASPPVFQQWFKNSESGASGGGFTYTQPFTVSTDADIIGGVTVMLENEQGQSVPVSAQSSN